MRTTGSATGFLPLVVLIALASPLLLPHARSTSAPAPTLLVLGAAQYNGQPSPAFRQRLDHAAALYRRGSVRRVVVTGGVGRGDRFSEGQVGVAYLERHGLPRTALVAETRSLSTLENVRNARAFIRGRVTLVTDDAHATRALALAKATGLDANVSAVPLSLESANASRYRLREKLLLAAYALLGTSADPRSR